MWISRKLEGIHQELDILAGQGKAVGLHANVETAQKFSSLVEDIREAMMNYQVRVSAHPSLLQFLKNASDLVAKR